MTPTKEHPVNLRTEPIRLPAWVVSASGVVVIPAATALLEGQAWKPVLIATLAAVSVLLGGAETARAFVTSPAHRTDTASPPTGDVPVLGNPDPANIAGTEPGPDPTADELARAVKHSAQTAPDASDTPHG